MLVIHPTDRSTSMLSALYAGLDARRLDERSSAKEINHALNHTPRGERIVLLGHGSDKGLFSRLDDTQAGFDRIIVGHPQAYYLRRHGANIVAIWCNADLFAKAEGLHGLFSGMIVSEMDEATLYGITTTQAELDEETVKLARRLRSLLDEDIPLSALPQRIAEMDDAHTPLTTFNYSRFSYL